METLSITGQAAHSKGIYREAKCLQNDGWYVMADHVSGFVLDIYAIKEELSSIIVIVTSLRHNQHQSVLREYAKHYPDIQFQRWLVNEAGCRVTSIK